MKLVTGDEVIVLQGKDKGKKGNLEKVFPKKNQVLVSGVNIYKKHVKRTGKVPGGITDIIKPLHIAKVALVCPKCNLATKTAVTLLNGKKVRVCKKCKQEI